jgi:hypothetical protein
LCYRRASENLHAGIFLCGRGLCFAAGTILTATLERRIENLCFGTRRWWRTRAAPRQQPLLATDVESANWLTNGGCIS